MTDPAFPDDAKSPDEPITADELRAFVDTLKQHDDRVFRQHGEILETNLELLAGGQITASQFNNTLTDVQEHARSVERGASIEKQTRLRAIAIIAARIARTVVAGALPIP